MKKGGKGKERQGKGKEDRIRRKGGGVRWHDYGMNSEEGRKD